MKFQMRQSRVLGKLASGDLVRCVKLNLSDARVVEIAAQSGFDCLWIDQEHVANDITQIEYAVRTAKVYDCDVLVRVPRGSYSDLVRPLEVDAAGIMVPHLMNTQEARAIAMQTKFHPIGRRALDGGNADGAFTRLAVADYMKQANERRFVVVQIEDPEAIEHLDEIASTPGIDMLFFGPGDFSQGIGHPGEFTHPRVIEARKLVAQAALRHGKYAGTVVGKANLQAAVDLGYRFLSMGADVAGLVNYFNGIMADFASCAGDDTPDANRSTSIYSSHSR